MADGATRTHRLAFFQKENRTQVRASTSHLDPTGELSLDDFFSSYIFFHEYCSRTYEGEETTMMTVMDVGDLKLRQLSGTVLGILAKVSCGLCF